MYAYAAKTHGYNTLKTTDTQTIQYTVRSHEKDPRNELFTPSASTLDVDIVVIHLE